MNHVRIIKEVIELLEYAIDEENFDSVQEAMEILKEEYSYSECDSDCDDEEEDQY